VEKAFDKDDKKPKETARKMMQMMFAIDANNFEGNQAVTCYLPPRQPQASIDSDDRRIPAAPAE
jgi:hypothetical protein